MPPLTTVNSEHSVEPRLVIPGKHDDVYLISKLEVGGQVMNIQSAFAKKAEGSDLPVINVILTHLNKLLQNEITNTRRRINLDKLDKQIAEDQSYLGNLFKEFRNFIKKYNKNVDPRPKDYKNWMWGLQWLPRLGNGIASLFRKNTRSEESIQVLLNSIENQRQHISYEVLELAEMAKNIQILNYTDKALIEAYKSDKSEFEAKRAEIADEIRARRQVSHVGEYRIFQFMRRLKAAVDGMRTVQNNILAYAANEYSVQPLMIAASFQNAKTDPNKRDAGKLDEASLASSKNNHVAFAKIQHRLQMIVGETDNPDLQRLHIDVTNEMEQAWNAEINVKNYEYETEENGMTIRHRIQGSDATDKVIIDYATFKTNEALKSITIREGELNKNLRQINNARSLTLSWYQRLGDFIHRNMSPLLWPNMMRRLFESPVPQALRLRKAEVQRELKIIKKYKAQAQHEFTHTVLDHVVSNAADKIKGGKNNGSFALYNHMKDRICKLRQQKATLENVKNNPRKILELLGKKVANNTTDERKNIIADSAYEQEMLRIDHQIELLGTSKAKYLIRKTENIITSDDNTNTEQLINIIDEWVKDNNTPNTRALASKLQTMIVLHKVQLGDLLHFDAPVTFMNSFVGDPELNAKMKMNTLANFDRFVTSLITTSMMFRDANNNDCYNYLLAHMAINKIPQVQALQYDTVVKLIKFVAKINSNDYKARLLDRLATKITESHADNNMQKGHYKLYEALRKTTDSTEPLQILDALIRQHMEIATLLSKMRNITALLSTEKSVKIRNVMRVISKLNARSKDMLTRANVNDQRDIIKAEAAKLNMALLQRLHKSLNVDQVHVVLFEQIKKDMSYFIHNFEPAKAIEFGINLEQYQSELVNLTITLRETSIPVSPAKYEAAKELFATLSASFKVLDEVKHDNGAQVQQVTRLQANLNQVLRNAIIPFATKQKAINKFVVRLANHVKMKLDALDHKRVSQPSTDRNWFTNLFKSEADLVQERVTDQFNSKEGDVFNIEQNLKYLEKLLTDNSELKIRKNKTETAVINEKLSKFVIKTVSQIQTALEDKLHAQEQREAAMPYETYIREITVTEILPPQQKLTFDFDDPSLISGATPE